MQGGAASAIIVIVLFLITSAALLSRFDMMAGMVNDTVTASMRLQALYLAESGLERASRRFVASGIPCGSLAESNIALSNVGTFSISNGSTLGFDGVTSAGGSCRVQVSGKTASGGVVRTIEAMITPFVVTSASRGNRDFTCTVPPGENLLTVISVSWSTSTSATTLVPPVLSATVVLGGVRATPVPDVLLGTNPVRNTDGPPITLRVSAQNFYVPNPPTGSSVAGTVTLDLNGVPTSTSTNLIVGCLTLAGVNQSKPIDQAASRIGTGGTPGIDFPTGQANTFVIDNLVRDNTGSLTMLDSTSPPRTQMWNFNPSGSAGAGSYRGLIPTSSTVPMYWNWKQNKIWAVTAVSIAGDATSGSGARVRLPGGGVSGWREIVTATLP